MGLGFGIGILVVACKSITHREKCGYEVVLPYSLPVLGGGVAIGGIIDTLIHRTIYSKSAGNVLGRLVLEPSVGPGSAGALVAIRW